MSSAQLQRPAPPPKGRRPAWLIAPLVAVMLVACQAASPSTSPSPSPTPTPTPTPEPPSAEEVMGAFLQLVGDEELTMHVVLDGTVDVTVGDEQQGLQIAMDMDISGPDGFGSATLDTGPGEISFTMLLIDDLAYIDDEGTWTPIPDYRQSTPLNPFFALSRAADLAYDGLARLDGRQVHHLRALVWIGGDLAELEEQGWANVQIDYNDSDIFVDDAGTPVRLEFHGGVSGQYQGVEASAAFDVAYDFTKVGEPVELPAPPASPAASAPS